VAGFCVCSNEPLGSIKEVKLKIVCCENNRTVCIDVVLLGCDAMWAH
jgi:hypothetical protein